LRLNGNGLGATIESHVPGRVRARLPRENRGHDILQEIHDILSDVEGILSVVMNPRTGSVLVNYDPDRLDFDALVQLARAAGIIRSPSEPRTHNEKRPWPHRSESAERLISGFRTLDRRIHLATNGAMDLKMLIPLVLVGISLGRAIARRDKGAIPTHVLLWYAYNIFMQWNQPSQPCASSGTGQNVTSG
jgi:hypothetical protein